MTTVSIVRVAPRAAAVTSNPNAPSANAPSLATSFQNSRRAMSKRRMVSSRAQATDAIPNRIAVVASTLSTNSARAQVTVKITTTAMACDWNSARRIPASKRSSTVSESPIHPVCTELTVIKMPKSRLNVPSPVTPNSRSTRSAISRLVPATIICDAMAPSGRRLMFSRCVRALDGRRRRRSGPSATRRVAVERCRGHAHRCRARRSSSRRPTHRPVPNRQQRPRVVARR